MTEVDSSKNKKQSSNLHAVSVALGIFFSRIAGLIRMRILAHYLGDSNAADAFYAALKIPNFLQNLFGEGVLSASFIPVYANLIAKNEKKSASELASALFAVLAVIITLLVLLGIWFTPYFIEWIAPGFSGETKQLTIKLVQILFPGTGLLVLSAWCLGVLNSHHKFFLSYVAPVFWNGAIIAFVLLSKNNPQNQIAIMATWGVVAGSLIQFIVQFPKALLLVTDFRWAIWTEFSRSIQGKIASVKIVVSHFIPVVFSRGVVQTSAYIDGILASFLPMGSVSALGYAQAIYMLPVSLFGMSISASELPTLSKAHGQEGASEFLRSRLISSFRKIAFFVIPTVVAFLFLGDLIVAILFQTGEFQKQTSIYVWTVLAGSAVGLLASTWGRLLSSTFYSLQDTKTPLLYSFIRVILSTILGYLMGLKAPEWLGVSASWGTCGLTTSAGISGWIEFLLLRRSLFKRIGRFSVPISFSAKLWLASMISGGFAFYLKNQILAELHPIIRGFIILSSFGIIFITLAYFLKIDECRSVLEKVLKGKKKINVNYR